MPITIHLSEEAEKRLEVVAAVQGYGDVAAYVENLVVKNVQEAASLEQAFQQLADQWHSERGATSMARHMAKHPAYRKIIVLGEKVVPLILAELERQPDHRFLLCMRSPGPVPFPNKVVTFYSPPKHNALEGIEGQEYGLVVHIMKRPVSDAE